MSRATDTGPTVAAIFLALAAQRLRAAADRAACGDIGGAFGAEEEARRAAAQGAAAIEHLKGVEGPGEP
jgi:hypothetical protein